MMMYLFVLSLFFFAMGYAGINGYQPIPAKYKGHEWTPEYKKFRGHCWAIAGAPWIFLALLSQKVAINDVLLAILAILCVVPSIWYYITNEKKFAARL